MTGDAHRSVSRAAFWSVAPGLAVLSAIPAVSDTVRVLTALCVLAALCLLAVRRMRDAGRPPARLLRPGAPLLTPGAIRAWAAGATDPHAASDPGIAHPLPGWVVPMLWAAFAGAGALAATCLGTLFWWLSRPGARP
ncbi:hypothetical protein [Palleronia rufa]|uniref:hypothetical protein n=1 Tax=Palleronia rufa TaxID=1530186 RepID=UPI00055E67D8|nr:hypothetical protein [Palleronia rufa]